MMIMIQAAGESHRAQDEDAASSQLLHSPCSRSQDCVSRCAAYGRVCPCSARSAGKAVHKKLEKILRHSAFFQEGKPMMRSVAPSEIMMGEKLGEGGFSQVDACSFQGACLEEACAIKYLKRRVMVNQKTFEHGAADLATEAFFLAKLDHPNVIKLHAVTAGNFESNVSTGKDAGFFIVVDRLVETLEHRILRWRNQVDSVPHNLFNRLSREYRETQKYMLRERLGVALDIAKTLSYLHSQSVLFRDLKPDNVGFDQSGRLKLFDFGLAKEEKKSEEADHGTYRMTGHTGSRRYMAPEVATDLPYNRSVDVYSFGILLWEICSLEKPFSGYSSKRHMKDVVIGSERPKMDSSHTSHWPTALQWLMKSCWARDTEQRPTVDIICTTLEVVMEDLLTVRSVRGRARSDGCQEGEATMKKSKEAHIKKSPKSPKRFGVVGRMRAQTTG